MKSTKNYIYNLTYNIFAIILPLITAPYLSRVLGPEGIGIFAYYFALSQLFALIARLGLTNYGTRRIAQVRDNPIELRQEFTNIYMMQIFACIFTGIVYYTFSFFMFYSQRSIAFVFGLSVIGVIFNVDWLLFGLEQFRKTALRSMAVKIINAICIFVFVKDANDVWKYCFIISVGYVIGYLAVWVDAKKYIDLHRIKMSEVLIHVKPCLVLMIPVIALNIYRSMDKVMLGYLSTISEVGLYENAERLIYSLTMAISSLGVVMMPKMSNLVSSGERNKHLALIEKSIIFIVFLTSAMCFGIISIANSLIPVLYGREFHNSIALVCYLGVTLVIIGCANVIRTQYIMPTHQDRIYIISCFLGAVVNLVLNTMLIPLLGAVGACIGTIFAEGSVLLYQWSKTRKDIPYFRYMKLTFPFLAFGLLMLILLKIIEKALGTGVMTMLIEVVVGGATYLTLSIVYLRKAQPEMASDLFRKFRRR